MNTVVIKSVNREEIDKAVCAYISQLREQHPEVERVIWFGSWVNGLPTPGSDVDICLILSTSNKSIRERTVDYLPVGFPVGINLIAYTSSEFERLNEKTPTWYATIISGREL